MSPHHRFFALALALVLGVLPGCLPAQQTASTPSRARLVTDDAERFWKVWDASSGKPDARALQQGYLDPGTPGLDAFVRLRIGSANQLAQTVASRRAYYASLRGLHAGIATRRDDFIAAFTALEALYPPAVFPDVYFVIGRMNSAGTLADEGLLIGLDMHGRQAHAPLETLSAWERAVIARPEDLPRIVAHELIHFQQFGRAANPSLLQQAIAEGAADFLAERIAGGHVNALAHAWGRANECALWREFAPRMAGTDVTGFLYDGDSATGRPADLGYFIGYRIVEAFVARHGLSEASLRRILDGADAEALLQEGGYAPCPPAAQ